ncbi:unnamed protein product [Orchesella dallaii]|uniref:Uncharacterized protein n=1 Tax=Orchesella dallaii TaxID=48710 RepID=A0ABP1RRJ3_9HEXA
MKCQQDYEQNKANEQVIKKLRIENNELPVLKQKIETLTNLQRKINDKKQELDKEVEGYKKQVTSLSHELKEVEIKFRRELKKEMQKVENELNDVVDSNENLKVEVTKLTAENKYLKEKVDAYAKKHKDQIIFLFSIIKSRKNVIIDLRNKNLEMTVSSSKNRLQYRKLLESNQEYEQNLSAESATKQKTLKENVDLKQKVANENNNVEPKSKYASKINKEMEKKMSELGAKNKDLQCENKIIKKESIERLPEEQRRLFETTIKGVDDDVKVLCSKMTPGADSNPECSLGVTNRVVPKDVCKVRVGPSTEGSSSAITAKSRFAPGNNRHRHTTLHPVPLMSLKLPYRFNLRQATLLHERQQGDIDHPYNTTKMNRIIEGAKHDNDKNGKILKRKLCNEEADLNINLVKCQLQQETQLSRDSTCESVALLEETAEKKNKNDCEYPPKKRICVDKGNIPMGLDEANGLDELEEVQSATVSKTYETETVSQYRGSKQNDFPQLLNDEGKDILKELD